VLLLNVNPEGSDGEIEKLVAAPPELLTLTVEIALLALTDCTALESEIEGAEMGATTVKVKFALEDPPLLVAVMV